jgi:ApbE superfamily uncharacterized protein (UPF0280 family)
MTKAQQAAVDKAVAEAVAAALANVQASGETRKDATERKLQAFKVTETFKDTTSNGRVWVGCKVLMGGKTPKIRRVSREVFEGFCREVGVDVDAKTLNAYFGKTS